MPLADVDLPFDETALPGAVRSFLDEADRRIERFQQQRCIPAFVPSDFKRSYDVLRALAAAELAPGNRFCEWGSGFGVVACLAAMLDFEAYGIEVEGELVDAARELAGDFSLPVEFVRGSFIPAGGEAHAGPGGFAWLATGGESAHEELGLAPDDFDVIFAYPWPDEEAATGGLFRRYAGVGAVLVTYHEVGEFRVRRKTGAKGNRW